MKSKFRIPVLLVFSFFTILLFSASLQAAFFPQKGILIYPIEKEKKWLAEPGKIAFVKNYNSIKKLVDLEIDGVLYPGVKSYYIIPFDPDFSVSKIYISILNIDDLLFSNDKNEEVRYRYFLSRNICIAFPNHPLFEDIHYYVCKLSAKYESEFESNEGKRPLVKTMSHIEDHLKKFPKGRYKDELEWRLILLKNHVYEYEGETEEPIKHAQIFSEFLKKNPNSKVKSEIQLHIAKLYRIIYEYSNTDKQNLKIQAEYKEKAIKMYKKILVSGNLVSREIARVALYNIAHNRYAYQFIKGRESDW
ncbi:MAG: hypothetical protein LLG40_02680 [Deltaproteobacteria bacterium]|nr:hypothetical protein [Deltaproteobacteria bacterium]